MKARSLLFVFLTVLLASRTALAQVEPPRPNIVFILVDDLGWTDVGNFGSTFYETPNIDRLANEGMTFTNAYAAAPVCSPSRAAILTGQYPARLNQTDWIPGRGNHPDQPLSQVEDLNALPHETVTIAEALREAGYASASIGKWHLGGKGSLPEDHGFDLNVAGKEYGSPPDYFYPYGEGEYMLADLAASGKEGENLTERLAEEAGRFISQHRERPFFVYLPFYAVHNPLQARPEQIVRYQRKADRSAIPDSAEFGLEGKRPVRQIQNHPIYAGLIETLDGAVGRVLQALEENGVADNTLVIFYSDNGGLSITEGAPTSNLPLRAGKGYLYEGGIREPLIVRWPGVVQPGSTYDLPVAGTDFFPTVLDAAGVGPPPDRALDGVSLMPVLQGTSLDRTALYWHYPHYSNQGGTPSGAIRAGDYKLLEFYEDGRLELYNLAADPGERHNLAVSMPDKAEALRVRLDAWRESVDAQMPVPNPGHAGSRGSR